LTAGAVTLARAPDAAPTGKTQERVKERGTFYSIGNLRQGKIRACNAFVFSGVQPVHRQVPENGASGGETERRLCATLDPCASSRACAADAGGIRDVQIAAQITPGADLENHFQRRERRQAMPPRL
jgi:hypothetical protein